MSALAIFMPKKGEKTPAQNMQIYFTIFCSHQEDA
jgi:hypothetical protein